MKSYYQRFLEALPDVKALAEAEEDQLKECQYYTVEDLFCCGYARYFWEAIKIRYPEYCFYKDWEDMYAEN